VDRRRLLEIMVRASLAGIPIIWTRGPDETVELIKLIGEAGGGAS